MSAILYNSNLGTWMAPFDRRRTQEMDFHTLTEGVVKCQMMFDETYYEYAHLDDIEAEAIKIPFE